jgi:hypothetical protein
MGGHVLRVDDPSQLPPHLRAQVERALAGPAKPGTAMPVMQPSPGGPVYGGILVVEPKGAIALVAPPAPKKRRGDPEHQQQKILMNRLLTLAENQPRYAMAWKRTHAIPNGGKRGKAQAGKLKAEGVKTGVPDVFVALPVGRFHGLYIEMKRVDGGGLSRKQDEWIRDSLALGYMAACCKGAAAAEAVWRDYVDGKLE